MASKDLNELRNKLFNEKYEVLNISEDINMVNEPSNTATVVLKKGENKVTLKSSETDFFIYVTQLHVVVNGTGRETFAKVKDTGKYYSDMDYLIDIDHNKVKKARDEIISGQFKFGYDFSKLLDGFLKNPKGVGCQQYLSLKKDYHHILASSLLLSEQMLKIYHNLEKKYAEAKDIKLSIDTIMRSFLSTGSAIKDYIFYKNYLNFDINERANRASIQLHVINDTMKEFKKRQVIDAKIAIPRMMNLYTRLLEILEPLLNLTRIGLELRRGNPSPEKEYSLQKNIEILQADQEYGKMFNCLDPQIRHSDVHVSIRSIDKVSRLVYLDVLRKRDSLACVYTFDELTTKINVMLNKFYPAVFPTIILFDISILDVLLVSREYKLRLLALGNS